MVYNIEIPHSSYDYKSSSWSGYGLNLILHENAYNDFLETRIYTFETEFAKRIKDKEMEMIITQYFFDLYNGLRLIIGDKPFKQYPNRIHELPMTKFLEVDTLLLNLEYPEIENNHLKFLHYEYLNIAYKSKINMDSLVLLSRANKYDGNSLINYYRLYDIARRFKDEYKEKEIDISEIDELLKSFRDYNNFSNNYNSAGIIGRHGNKKGSSKVTIDKFNNFTNDTKLLVKKIFEIQKFSKIIYEYPVYYK